MGDLRREWTGAPMDLCVLRDAGVLLGAWAEESDVLPALITVVVTHGPFTWGALADVRERMGPLPVTLQNRVPSCPYTVLDLRTLMLEQLTSAPLTAQIAVTLLKAWSRFGAGPEMWETFASLAPTMRELVARFGHAAYYRFLRCLFLVTPRDAKEAAMGVLTTVDDTFPAGFVFLADAYLMKGREEGRRLEALQVLIITATPVLGPPDEVVKTSLARLELDAVHELASRLFTVTTWAELMAEPQLTPSADTSPSPPPPPAPRDR